MMTDETRKLRTNSASGVGGKDYYPQVDELVDDSCIITRIQSFDRKIEQGLADVSTERHCRSS